MKRNRDEFILECNKKTAFEEVSANPLPRPLKP